MTRAAFWVSVIVLGSAVAVGAGPLEDPELPSRKGSDPYSWLWGRQPERAGTSQLLPYRQAPSTSAAWTLPKTTPPQYREFHPPSHKLLPTQPDLPASYMQGPNAGRLLPPGYDQQYEAPYSPSYLQQQFEGVAADLLRRIRMNWAAGYGPVKPPAEDSVRTGQTPDNTAANSLVGQDARPDAVADDLERRQSLDWIPGYGPSNGSRTRRIGN